ncbi:MAG: hypothetical protein ABIK97_05165 [candidate division WOR-3 bacterium]
MSYYYYVVSAKQRRDFAEEDFKLFLEKLAESLYLNNALLHAFSFLPPRFYLLLESSEPKIDRFMQHLNVSFAMVLKLQRNHQGPLFSGRYTAYPFTNKNYLLPVSQYLHLLHLAQNPNSPLVYPWSSLPGYLNERKAIKFITYETILKAAGGRKGYERKLKILAKKINPQEALDQLFHRMKPAVPKKGEGKRIKPEIVMRIVAQAFGLKKEELLLTHMKGKIRGIAAEFLLKFSQLTQNEIGQLLGGIGYSAVSHLRYRMRERLMKDEKLREKFQKIEEQLLALV